MERKFASKLSKKPAAEARRQASTQLKENIQSAKLKRIDPVDFDAYVKQNYEALRKNACSEQLILLPEDDLYDEYQAESSRSDSVAESVGSVMHSLPAASTTGSSLFVTDCLQTYNQRGYEIKCKQEAYSGTFKQLPGYESRIAHLKQMHLVDKCYEIDLNLDDSSAEKDLPNGKSNSLMATIDKQGWLSYKSTNNGANDTKVPFKRRYVRLRQVHQSSGDSGRKTGRSSASYVLECFKEAPGSKQRSDATPKMQLFFYLNQVKIKKCSEVSALAFELVEHVKLPTTGNQTSNSLPFSINTSLLTKQNNNINSSVDTISHLFIAESQKHLEEWYSVLETIIHHSASSKLNTYNQYQQKNDSSSVFSSPSTMSSSALKIGDINSTSTSNHQLSTSSVSPTSNSFASLQKNSSAAIANPDCFNSDSLNASNDQNDSNESVAVNATHVSDGRMAAHHQPTSSYSSMQCFLDSFNLSKYLNESEEDLVVDSQIIENGDATTHLPETEQTVDVNVFDLSSSNNETVNNEEIELTSMNSDGASDMTGHKLLVSFDKFKLHLSLANSSSEQINPELFYLTFALYDLRHGQKMSANFNWSPELDKHQTSHNNEESNTQSSKTSSLFSSVFSLDGKQFSRDPQSILTSDLTASLVNRISKALFSIIDVHDEIFLVARIDKVLDGSHVRSSVAPYLSATGNETTRSKTAIKLNKKMQQLLKTQLAAYRQPFAWASKPVFKKSDRKSYELDNQTPFSIYEQDVQHLGEADILKYIKEKEKYTSKLNQINGSLVIKLDLLKDSQVNNLIVINSSMSNRQLVTRDRVNDCVLEVSQFESTLPISLNEFIKERSLSLDDKPLKNETKNVRASLGGNGFQPRALTNSPQEDTEGATSSAASLIRSLRPYNEFKSFLYVYPKHLKYDTQKHYSKARNILVRVEFRERDNIGEDSTLLKCIYKPPHLQTTSREDSALFSTFYLTPIAYHNKSPQFYDEIKILLPLNLTEKHHVLFKFYHVSCSTAKSSLNKHNTTSLTIDESMMSQMNKSVANGHGENQSVLTLIGLAWLPIFKNGRLFSGEKTLPVAQTASSNYLTCEQIGLGQMIGPGDIKWVENMKPLFKVAVAPLSTIHTTDPNLANFYTQYEKVIQAVSSANNAKYENNKENVAISSTSKRQAPVLAKTSENGSEATTSVDESLVLRNSNSNELNKISSTKNIKNIVWSKPVKEELSLSYHLKALQAAELSTVIKFLPTLFNRLLLTLMTTSSEDVAQNSIKTLLHYSSQLNSINKSNFIRSFIKHAFYIDYYNQENRATSFQNSMTTVHEAIVPNLATLIKQNSTPTPDTTQHGVMLRFYNSCWVFLEIVLKSMAIYKIGSKKVNQVARDLSSEYYNSLQVMMESLIDSIVRSCSQVVVAKDSELLEACKTCNKSLAIFVKKSLNILNRKFLFILMDKYLQSFHLCDRAMFEMKIDFIRTVCNHEHYVAFSLPVRKCVSNINEFTDIKYEFVLSDQYRQLHFLSGVMLGQLFSSLNENKELRKQAIRMFRHLLMKHAYDDRYNDKKIKMARVTSLYIPFIDILIENMSRILSTPTPNNSSSQLQPKNALSSLADTSSSSAAPGPASSTSGSILSRAVSSITNQTLVNSHNLSSSASMANGSLYAFNLEQGLHRLMGNDPLAAIAGIVNPNKLQDNLDHLISDTDSLSSADDPHFKGKRTSSSILTSNSSTANSDNANTILTNSESAATASSIVKSIQMTRKDKFDSQEVKDLLLCTIFILGNISEDAFLGLWFNYDDAELVEFLRLLDLCLKTFRYRGKQNIQRLNVISKGGQEIRFKSPIMRAVGSESGESVLVESNLCHQVSSTVVSILSLVLVHQKEKICENNGENAVTHRLVELYFQLLQSNQSKSIRLKVLASLRHLINASCCIFINGQSVICSSLCIELLKCFNSNLDVIRQEACVVLYLLMRKNYEMTKMKSIARVHSQTIISVSQLIGQMKLKESVRVIECLSLLNQLAAKDQTLSQTRFAFECQDLTRRIRNIFQATSQMNSYYADPESLVDCQYSLAKSYANCVELRKTWLESMATLHISDKNYSEAAHCYLHIAAQVAENLKHQGLYTLGLNVFKKISPNIELEEEMILKNSEMFTDGDIFSMKDLNEVVYTQSHLLDYLCKSAEMFKLSERYEFLPDIFKLAVAIYEPSRDYVHLQQMHLNIQKAYSYLAERDQKSKDKPLASFYRVSFFGKLFEQENNKVYIYKEPSNTKLFEVCDRIRKLYARRYGDENSVEILCDSRKPSELKLDTNCKNYIQITYVQPYFEPADVEAHRSLSYFERNNNLKQFFYETPYQLPAAGSESLDQLPHNDLLTLCKRKFILETANWFPYVKKRILVIYEKPIDLNPLETAIDEICQKVKDFEQIVHKKDLTLLELYLQGGIMPQVHKGPLAYAEAFLEPNQANKNYSKELKRRFKLTFKRLIDLYQVGIELYFQLASKSNEITAANNKLGGQSIQNNSLNISTSTTVASAPQPPHSTVNPKFIEMHKLLQEKFNEMENSFRNLLLIADDDLDLYHQLRDRRNSTQVGGIDLNGSVSQA